MPVTQLPDEKLRSAENAHGNFDARQFHCILRAEPFWTNLSEVRGQRPLKDAPDYWTKSSYHLEIIPVVVVAVILGGTLLAGFLWIVCWTFGLSLRARLAPHVNAWVTAVITGTISTVIAGVILSKIL
jgi:hypothetical protein